MEGAERFPISDNKTLYEYRKSRLSKHLRSARYRLTKNSEFSLYSYLHASFVPIMAETDDNSALLLRQDGLIYGPAGVQMRQKIRHSESRKNATIDTSNPTSFKPSRGNPKTESSVCITRPKRCQRCEKVLKTKGAEDGWTDDKQSWLRNPVHFGGLG